MKTRSGRGPAYSASLAAGGPLLAAGGAAGSSRPLPDSHTSNLLFRKPLRPLRKQPGPHRCGDLDPFTALHVRSLQDPRGKLFVPYGMKSLPRVGSEKFTTGCKAPAVLELHPKSGPRSRGACVNFMFHMERKVYHGPEDGGAWGWQRNVSLFASERADRIPLRVNPF